MSPSAFLRAPQVDRFWHPFSIASDPNSGEIEFYLEIYGTKSWTRQLWNALVKRNPDDYFPMEIIGPYGTGIVNKRDYSQVVAIGSGTGVVPILSVFKEHIHHLLMINPSSHYNAQHEREIRSMKVCRAKEARDKTIFQALVSGILYILHVLGLAKKQTDQEEEPKAERKQERVKKALHRLSSHLEQEDEATYDPTISTASPDNNELETNINGRKVMLSTLATTCPKKEMQKAIFAATRSSEYQVFICFCLAFLTLKLT